MTTPGHNRPGPEAFYIPTGADTFTSTPATTSPWDATMQHGGPPAALLARAVAGAVPEDDLSIARITVDMLGPIPQGRIRTEAEVVRPGRRVAMVHARLWAEDRLAVTATAWAIRRTSGSTAEVVTELPAPAPPPTGPAPEVPFFTGVWADWGYGHAIDWRFRSGSFDRPGPAAVWTRLRLPLVAGETTRPIERMLAVADAANGVSGELPLTEWLYIPPSLSLTVQRAPDEEWMLLDARTTIGSDGIGLCQATMSDRHGLLGVVAQPLLVAPRGT